jgi:type IV pilus assembly protein PilW
MKSQHTHRQAGLSLVELMVSITIGLLILLALTTLFVNNSKTQVEIEKSNRQQENGRYALQLLTNDLRVAGYFDTHIVTTAPTSTAALPDPCAIDTTTLDSAMTFHIQGYDNIDGGLTCISDVKTGTDVLVVRHAATCRSANPLDANCDGLANGPAYLQVSGCEGETPGHLVSNLASDFTLKTVNCTDAAPVSKLRTNIYYIANNNIGSDGIPTLKRAELSSSGGTIAFAITPLVDGIENLQILYGTSPGSAAPTSYTSAPTDAPGWWNVTAVQVSLLARNETPSAGYTDTKKYYLSGSPLVPFYDNYRRHVYSSLVTLSNITGRRS